MSCLHYYFNSALEHRVVCRAILRKTCLLFLRRRRDLRTHRGRRHFFPLVSLPVRYSKSSICGVLYLNVFYKNKEDRLCLSSLFLRRRRDLRTHRGRRSFSPLVFPPVRFSKSPICGVLHLNVFYKNKEDRLCLSSLFLRRRRDLNYPSNMQTCKNT